MAHIYKAEEWNSLNRWYVGDVSALAAGSNTWWYVPRLLDISPVDYISLLIQYGATGFKYNSKTNVLVFYFPSLEKCRKYKNYINKVARDKNFVIY